ncbi:MAG: hypothetical protein AAB289_13325, partial [Chloroflexota bacterium]
DKECGYAKEITASDYRFYFDREGIAERVVKVWPRESWRVDPDVWETDDAEETAWEKAWTTIEERLGVYSYFQRLDELAGIGHYGVLLLAYIAPSREQAMQRYSVGRRARPDTAPENYALLGTAENIIDKVREYVAAGATKFVFRLACPEAEVSQQLKLLADEVVRPVHSGALPL